MNIQWFVILCTINFTSLLFVSMLILFYLKKQGKVASEAAQKLLDQEEDRLNQILDEIANISTALYGDIEDKQKQFARAMDEAQEKIDLLQKLSYIEAPGLTKQKSRQRRDSRSGRTQSGPVIAEKKPMQASAAANSQNVFDVIYGLSDKGQSILEIAKIVNKPKGEVELILNLRHATRSLS